MKQTIKAKEYKQINMISNLNYHSDLLKINNMVEDKINNIPKNYYNGFFGFIRKWHIKQVRKQLEISKIWIEKSKISKDKLDHSSLITNTVNLLRHKNLLDFTGWTKELKDKFNSGKTFLINMQLRNGTHTNLLVVLENKYFEYEDGRYIIDDDYKYYNSSSKIYCLDYHQDCCIPLKRNFNMRDIEEALSSNTDIDTETSINPKSLKIFMESDIIQKVISGEEAEKHIKFIKFMLIMIAIGVAIILVITLRSVF